MLITDQVATAPCTDPIPRMIPTFEAKLRSSQASVWPAHARGNNNI